MATREFLFSSLNQAALIAYKNLISAGTKNPSLTSAYRDLTSKAASAASPLMERMAAVARYNLSRQYDGKSSDSSSYWAGEHVMRGAFDMASRVSSNLDYNQQVRRTMDMDAFAGVQLFTPKTSQDFTGFDHILTDSDGSHRYSDKEMRKLHEMFGKWSSDGFDEGILLDNFNRFYQIYPEAELSGGLKSYVFITRPEMNIFSGRSNKLVSENSTDPMIGVMARMNPELLHLLTKEYSSDHDFIPFLQGRTQSLQEVDYQIKTSDFTVPFYSYKYTYPTVTNESRTGGSFDITFREDEELRITKLFQFWVYYMDAINKDKLKVSAEHKKRNSFDYMCSVYHFICDPTSEWVLFWSKYTGCYPISVPISNLSFSLGDRIDNKVSITFNYMRAETLDPAILNDFMGNIHTTATNYLSLHDDQFDLTGPSLSKCPILAISEDKKKFLLKWLPYTTNGVGRSAMNSLDSFMPSAQTSLYNTIVNTAATAVKNTTTQLSPYKVADASPNIHAQPSVNIINSVIQGAIQGTGRAGLGINQLVSAAAQGFKK